MKKRIIALVVFFLIIGFLSCVVAKTTQISDEAVKNNDVLQVESDIKNGADVNAKYDASAMKNITALMCAAKYNSLDVAKLLIEKGADVDARDTVGNTSLAFAASFSSLDVAKLLIDRGADVNAKNSGGVTALLIVTKSPVYEHSVELVELLLKKGADANVMSEYGDTAFQNVVTCPHENCSQMLVLLKQYGAGPKELAQDGIYQIASVKIRFVPPSGWKIFRYDAMGIDFRPADIAGTNLSIIVFSPAEESELVRAFKESNEQKETTFLNSKAYIVEHPDGKLKSYKTIAVHKNGSNYVIRFEGNPSDYNNLLPLVQKSLETLQIE